MSNPEASSNLQNPSSSSNFTVKAILTIFLFVQVGGLCFVLWRIWPEQIPLPAAAAIAKAQASTGVDGSSGGNTATVSQPQAKVAGSQPATDSKEAPALRQPDAPPVRSDRTEKPLDERDLLLIVMIAGALGGALHGLYSICDYFGNRRFDWSWTVWYLVRAPVGAAVATVLYLALRGGFAGASGPESLNLYGIAGIAALAGMFNRPAVTKLAGIADQLFSKPPQQTGALQNPRATLTALVPAQIAAGTTKAKVVLHGSDFVKELTVLIDGVAHKAVWKSATEAELVLPDALVAAPKKLALAVHNPDPCLGESPPLSLEIVA